MDLQDRSRFATRLAVIVIAIGATLAGATASAQWSDDFDAYAAGTTIAGQGGWAGWDLAAVDADVVDERAFSDPNSLRLQPTSDMVQVFSGFAGGVWVARAKTFLPAEFFSGESWFILLNTYSHGGAKDWSTQVAFTNGEVVSAGGSNFGGTGTLPWIAGEWVDLEIEIDLDVNVQTIRYGGELLDVTPWTVSGLGEIQAIDLFSNNGSAFYFDDVSITPVEVGPRPVRTVAAPAPCPNPLPVQVSIAQPLAGGADPGELVTVTEVVSGKLGAAQVAAAGGGTVTEIVPTGLSRQKFINSWLLLGPFQGHVGADNPGCPEMQRDFLTDGNLAEIDVQPEEGQTIATDFGGLAASTAILGPEPLNPGGVPTWNVHHSADDTIDFNSEYYGGDLNNVMMYAFAYVRVEEAVDVDLCVGSDDAVQVIIDGSEAHCNSIARGVGLANQCQDTVPYGTLTAGEHTVMVKVFEGGGGHGFRFAFRAQGTFDPAGVPVCLAPGTDGCELSPVGAKLTWRVTRQELSRGVGYTVDVDQGPLRFQGDVDGLRTVGDRSVLVCPAATDSQGFITGSQFAAIGPFTHTFTCGAGLENLLLGNHIANASIRTEYPSVGDTIDYDVASAVSKGYLGPTAPDGKPLWRVFDDGFEDGAQDLNIGLGNREGVMGWLATYVEYRGAAPVDINVCFGSDDGGQLWWDCDLVANTRACQGLGACNVGTFPLSVEPGVHRIAAAAWDNTGGWALSVRLLESDGATPIADGHPDWKFLGRDRPPGFTPRECSGCPPEAVTDLTCAPGRCGLGNGIVLTWTNPPTIDPATLTRVEVNGVLVTTVAPDATTACVPSRSLPQGVYEIAVIHCGGVPAICSPFKTSASGRIRDSSWLVVGPFVNSSDGCDGAGADGMLLNHIAPTQIDCFYPAAGEEMAFDLADPEQASTGYFGPAGPNGDPVVAPYDDGVDDGDMDLDANYGDQSNVLAWLITYLEYTGDPGQVGICLGSDDSGQVWFNETMVLNDPACRPRGECDSQATVDVTAGVYRLAVGVWENGGGWGARFSLRDPVTQDPILDDGSSSWIFHGATRPPADKFPGGVVPVCDVEPPQGRFHRGDADGNGDVQLTDAIRILNFLFLGTGLIDCADAADADDNGELQLTDAVRILNYLFLGTGAIPAPGPTSEPCGPDPTSKDPMGCAAYDPASC